MLNNSDNKKRENVSVEQRILEAAENEFVAKGYAGARTISIAEAAGVTHAMLHYYYRTKEKLFSKVVSEKLSTLARTFAIKIDSDMSLADCIRGAVESHFEFVRANPMLPRFLVCEVFSNPEMLDRMQGQIETIANNTVCVLQAKIYQAAAEGKCRRDVSARSLMMDIVSLNAFPFLAAPMLCRMNKVMTPDGYDALLDKRREENVQTILRKLS